MAETFGAVAGALSVAALFTNCVEAFEYIQLGRHFDRDFTRCQLKLDIARTRLSRWGQASAIYDDPRFAVVTPSDRNSKHVRAILEEIEQLFEVLQKSSKRYEIDATQEDMEPWDMTNMELPGRLVHDRLATVTSQRQKRTSLFRKVAWALYDAKNFDRLIEQLTGFIDDLEKVFAGDTSCQRQLAELEIEGIENDSSLEMLCSAAASVDYVLSKAVVEKIEALGTRNRAADVQTEHSTYVRVGDEWSSEAMSLHRMDAAVSHSNQTGSIAARGKSRVHVGQSYGGQSIFHDVV